MKNIKGCIVGGGGSLLSTLWPLPSPGLNLGQCPRRPAEGFIYSPPVSAERSTLCRWDVYGYVLKVI